MNKNLQKLVEKYRDSFEFRDNGESLNIITKKPVCDNHPAIGAPAYLDYSIDKKDHRSVGLDDRSRYIWLRDNEGRRFQSASYCGGIGIWQVYEGEPGVRGVPIAFSGLTDEEQKLVEGWVEDMDEYIFNEMPDLKEMLEKQVI